MHPSPSYSPHSYQCPVPPGVRRGNSYTGLHSISLCHIDGRSFQSCRNFMTDIRQIPDCPHITRTGQRCTLARCIHNGIATDHAAFSTYKSRPRLQRAATRLGGTPRAKPTSLRRASKDRRTHRNRHHRPIQDPRRTGRACTTNVAAAAPTTSDDRPSKTATPKHHPSETTTRESWTRSLQSPLPV